MEPIVVLPAQQLHELIERYESTATQLIEVQRELQALKSDNYVPLQWVADLWSVELKTARQMIQVLAGVRKSKDAIKVLAYGTGVVRYRRSDILRITEENLVSLKDMLALKRANKISKMGK